MQNAIIDRNRLFRIADGLAVAVAASLPWSTSATAVLLVLWLIAVIPTLSWADLRHEVLSAAGGLPVLLVLLGIAGMAWADVSLIERWKGLDSFIKLLVIPLLLAQFRRSERADWVFGGYLFSCVVLLVASTLVQFVPGFSFIPMKWDHVLVRNEAAQSGEFVTCIFGLLFLVYESVVRAQWGRLLALLAVILGMVANILFVATGRTALVVMVVLLVLFAAKKLKVRGMLLLFVGTIAIVGAAWLSSVHLRDRVVQIWADYQKYEATYARNSSGERIEFAKKSIGFIRAAPIIGHGTGTIHSLFIESSVGQTGAAGTASTNPHNQTFAVAIQLGLIGAAVLWAMWIAHLLLFRGGGMAEWIGLVLVVQNIVGSLFNSHLFDFMQGWVYVIGVGVAGGAVLKRRLVGAPPGAAT
jgi:O-antigen ligase